MKKIVKKSLYILLFIIAGITIWYIESNSLNSIKRDFNRAMTYRASGDCINFVEYINVEDDEADEDWLVKCLEETNSDNLIKNFRILYASHKWNDKEAFIQASIQRDNQEKAYSVNYTLVRDGNRWKINDKVEKMNTE